MLWKSTERLAIPASRDASSFKWAKRSGNRAGAWSRPYPEGPGSRRHNREPRLALCAEHDLAWFLNDLGESEEALAVLDRARPLYRQFPDKWTQLRLHWLEGRIAYRLGEYPQAESIFAQIWEEFRARNLHHELVLISIDLAQVLAGKGELARAAQLATECYSIMRSWGLHKDALSAWLVFQDALAQGTAAQGIFGRLGDYYRRHWFMPAKFDPARS